MKQEMYQTIRVGILTSIIAVLGLGCSSTSSMHAKALNPTVGAGVDLGNYQTATIVTFETVAEVKDPSVGVRFAKDIGWRLRHRFADLFSTVREGKPTGERGELVITGIINNYDPGSRELRQLGGVIGGAGVLLGAAAGSSLHGELILKDGTDDRVIYRSPFDKLWAWSGAMGAKGIEDMEAEASAAIVNTVARAKGWEPPPDETEGKHPKYSDYIETLSPPPLGQGRVWVYRTGGMVGAAFAPQMRIDDVCVAALGSGQIFHIELEAGEHEVSYNIEKSKFTAAVQVRAGSTTFVSVQPADQKVTVVSGPILSKKRHKFRKLRVISTY